MPKNGYISKRGDELPPCNIDSKKLPRHIAIIMDGNGRWANEKGLPRISGHKAGISSVRDIATTCSELGVPVLTLYAFSKENWQRPKVEIKTLMTLLVEYLKTDHDTLMKNDIRLTAIGRLSDLPSYARSCLEQSIKNTKENKRMEMVLALSYSGRVEIVDAMKEIAGDVERGGLSPEQVNEQLIASRLYTAGRPDPDLLIRTGGDTRISNFLLWQMAYTELVFTKTAWPDFNRACLLEAILEFQSRERRFGLVKSNHGSLNGN